MSGRATLLDQICAVIDPRLGLTSEQIRNRNTPPLSLGQRPVVLVGHRSAGKTTLLPLISEWTGRPGVDLDAEIQRRTGQSSREWVQRDVKRFRELEREVFASLPPDRVIAAGGGFLSLHGDLLEGTHPVLVPVSFETYRERLLEDRTRPRLRPEVPLEEELRGIFEEREELHARRRTLPLVDFLAATWDGNRT